MNHSRILYTVIFLVVICCISYLLSHRYVISTTDKIAFVYDIFSGKMNTYNFNGKINADDVKVTEKTRYNKNKDKVHIYTVLDDSCTGDYKMQVLVENMSDDTLLSVAFSVDAREENLSSSIIDASKQEDLNIYIFDFITPPGTRASGCYKPPKVKNTKSKNIIFAPYGVVCTFMDTPGGSELIRARFNK